MSTFSEIGSSGVFEITPTPAGAVGLQWNANFNAVVTALDGKAATPAWTPDDLTSRNVLLWGDADDLKGSHGDTVMTWPTHGTMRTNIKLNAGVTLDVTGGIRSVAFVSGGGGGIIAAPSTEADLKGVLLAARYWSATNAISLIEKGFDGNYPYFLRVTASGSGGPTAGVGFYKSGDPDYVGSGSPVTTTSAWHTAYGKLVNTTASLDIDGGTPVTAAIVTPLPTNTAELVWATNYISGSITYNVKQRRFCIIDLSAGDLSSPDEALLRTWLAG